MTKQLESGKTEQGVLKPEPGDITMPGEDRWDVEFDALRTKDISEWMNGKTFLIGISKKRAVYLFKQHYTGLVYGNDVKLFVAEMDRRGWLKK